MGLELTDAVHRGGRGKVRQRVLAIRYRINTGQVGTRLNNLCLHGQKETNKERRRRQIYMERELLQMLLYQMLCFLVIIPTARQAHPADPAAAPCWNRRLILAAFPRHFLHRDLDPRERVLECTLQ